MTKKNYIAAAEIIRKRLYMETEKVQTEAINCFVEFFKRDNERFNEERFRIACIDVNSCVFE